METPESAEYTAEVTGHEPARLDPIPVQVTDPVRVEDRPARSWSAFQTTVTEAATQVAPYAPARSSLRLANTGASPIYLAPERHAATPSTGYPLAGGASIALDTIAEVYAAAGAGQSIALAVLAEHRDG